MPPPPPPPLLQSTKISVVDCMLCLQDSGLVMTAESSGVVSTLGWLPEHSPQQCVAHHKARGMSFGARDAANVLPTVFPDRSATDLGAPLVALVPGPNCRVLKAWLPSLLSALMCHASISRIRDLKGALDFPIDAIHALYPLYACSKAA